MATTATALQEAEAVDVDEPRPPRRRRRLVLVAGLVLLAAAALWWFVLRGGDEAGAEEPEPVEGAVVEVAQMTANLAGAELHYARFGFAVVLAEEIPPADVEGRFPLLRDAALSVVQGFSQDHLRTPEGTEQFRSELTLRARELYPDGEVLRVVITELVVQ